MQKAPGKVRREGISVIELAERFPDDEAAFFMAAKQRCSGAFVSTPRQSSSRKRALEQRGSSEFIAKDKSLPWWMAANALP